MKRFVALCLLLFGCAPKAPVAEGEATFVGIWKQTAEAEISADTPMGPHKDRGGNWFTNHNHADHYLTIEQTPEGLKIRNEKIAYFNPPTYGERINLQNGRLEFGIPAADIHEWYHLRLTNPDRIDGEKKGWDLKFYAACYKRMPPGFKIPYLPALPQ